MSKYRPVTTLSLLTSVDGKISTGDNVDRDIENDLAKFDETKVGLSKYRDIDNLINGWILTTGKVQVKKGINKVDNVPKRDGVCIAVVDNKHLSGIGVINLMKEYDHVVVFTSNTKHPALSIQGDKLNVHVGINFGIAKVLSMLYKWYSCECITIQTGATTNADLLKLHMIDYIDFIVAPVLIGGNNTPSVIGGDSIMLENDLSRIALMEFMSCKPLGRNYIRLHYKVLNSE